MLKNSKTIFLISGAASIVATILFYLLIFDNIFTVSMRWVSLMFLIIAECIGTVKALSIKKSIFGVANIAISLFHSLVVLLLSIVFVNAFPFSVKAYILWNLLSLGIMVVVDVIIIYFGGYVESKNNKSSESRAVSDGLDTKEKSAKRGKY